MRYVRVPMARVGVVIGPEGKTKALIERRCGVHLLVESKTGEVTVDDHEAEDPVNALKAEDIVKALGRGFSPEHALQLLSDDAYLEILDIHDYVGKRKKDIHRIVGRLVGAHGRTREILEELTRCHVTVYGHTVGIIGDAEGLNHCKQAVEMILEGSEHATVYRFLEDKRRENRMARMDF